MDIENLNTIKYRLIHQFYGIEEHMDMAVPLPTLIDLLSENQSDFKIVRTLTELDIWFVKISARDTGETWDPFSEPLYRFANRHEFVLANLFPDKQWPDSQIIQYANVHPTTH